MRPSAGVLEVKDELAPIGSGFPWLPVHNQRVRNSLHSHACCDDLGRRRILLGFEKLSGTPLWGEGAAIEEHHLTVNKRIGGACDRARSRHVCQPGVGKI